MIIDVAEKQEALSSIIPYLEELIAKDEIRSAVLFVEHQDGRVESRTFASNTPIGLIGAIEIWKIANFLQVKAPGNG